MLRNLINGKHTTELYTIGSSDIKRGSIVVKDYANKVVNKADGVGVEVYILDNDFQPTGYKSDMEISAYSDEADVVKANATGVLVKPVVGETWAFDQVVSTGLTAGDYAIAGTSTDTGKLVKATATKTSIFKYVGTYADGDKTLYAFEIVEPHTVA
jgi:uncharacterized membrane-anchored protein